MSPWLAPAAAFCAASLTLLAQQPPTPPQFRAGTDIVQLDVTVIDKKTRMPVRGLTAADFTVVEKDKPREIVAFAAIDVPDRDLAAASWTREIGPDVSTNNLDKQRLVIIVLDDFALPYHPRVYEGIRKVAYEAIDQLGPDDVATVIYLLNRRKGQEFTTDHASLRAAVDRYESNALFAGGGACMHNTCHMQMLQNIARSVIDLPARRKAVIFITDPYRRPPYDFRKEELENFMLPHDIRETFDLLRRGNVNVYIFAANSNFNKLPRPDQATYLPSALFASATGGWLATGGVEESWTAVERVFRENSSYYILGFPSSAQDPDGQFHEVTVKVNRPEVEVNARTGYFALKPKPAKPPKGEPPTALDQTIMGATPARDFPLSVSAVPIGRPGDKEAVVAILAGLDEDVGLAGPVEMVASVFRDDRKQQGEVTQKVDLGTGLPGPVRHWDLASRLNLKPGRYEVRVGLTHAESGRRASAYTSLTVPDISKASLALSGILLARHSPAPADGPRPLADIVPVVPTTVRAFRGTDEVAGFVRVTQGGNKPVVPVTITMAVVDTADRHVHSRTLTLDAPRFGRGRTADVDEPLPLAALEPGTYLLTIEASAGTVTSRRDVRFRVVE